MVSEDGTHEEARMNPLITENQQQIANINYSKFISLITNEMLLIFIMSKYDKFFLKYKFLFIINKMNKYL